MRTAALALLFCGCLQGVPDNINCLGDDTCPTDYYCSDNNLCVALADGTPPALVFNGVGTDPGAATGHQLNVPLSGLMFYVNVSNTGTHDANMVSIGFDGPPCADLRTPDAVPAVPAGSGTVVAARSTNPVLPCPDADYTVTLDVKQGDSLQPFHRVSSGTFRVHVGP